MSSEELSYDETTEQEKYKHLAKDEQIKERYGIEFEDLKQINRKWLDGSTHYYHSGDDTVYSWNFMEKYWYKSTYNFKQYL